MPIDDMLWFVSSTGLNYLQLDMEKLAEGLQKLDEDSLLAVVQLIHDNKTEATYVKNDVEREYPHSTTHPLLVNTNNS